MLYRQIGKTGIEASVLGMGCMRLPLLADGSEQIDEAKATELIRYAIDSGVNYIDTAYNYHGGNSEVVVGKALKDGYREKVSLVTKCPSWLIKTPEDFEKHLDQQLEKLGVAYLDIYLLHAMNKGFWENFKTHNIFQEIEKMKAKGKIKNIGFSFHDSFSVFEEVITGYPWDVCMLQFNYMDIEDQAGLSGLLLAEKQGIPVIVMEPLKGGLLINPPNDIQKIWDDSGRGWSPVEWSMRYVAAYENVKVVLSGMHTIEQVKENCQIAENLVPNSLNSEDQKVIDTVRTAYLGKTQIGCTDCKYCMPCPHGVEIPKVFGNYNRAHMFDSYEAVKSTYQAFIKPESRAGGCISCGECLPKCPQHIAIIDKMAQAKAYFGS